MIADLCHLIMFQTRFQISRCNHNFCGYCLQKTEVIVDFVKHKSEKVFACPQCVYTGYTSNTDTNWVTKHDVYDLLQEKVHTYTCNDVFLDYGS